MHQIDINEPIEGVLIPDSEARESPMLKIAILEGLPEMVGGELNINAQGMHGSKRNKKDGCTIIGSQTQDLRTMEFTNDFVIPNVQTAPDSNAASEYQQAGAGIGQRHMVIKFNSEDKKYYMRDLGDGSGTFVRVDNHSDLILKHGFIISFGDSHMVVQFSSDISDPSNPEVVQKITLKFLDGPKIDKEFSFTEYQKTIKIGRMSSCQIKFDDNALSRLQCQIEFRRYKSNDRYQYYNNVAVDGHEVADG